MTDVGGEQRSTIHRGHDAGMRIRSLREGDRVARERRRHTVRERRGHGSKIEVGRRIGDEERFARPCSARRSARGNLADDECRFVGRANRNASDRDVGDSVAIEIGEPVVGRRAQERGADELRRNEVERAGLEVVSRLDAGVAEKHHGGRRVLPARCEFEERADRFGRADAEIEFVVEIVDVDDGGVRSLAVANGFQRARGGDERVVADDVEVGRAFRAVAVAVRVAPR